MMESQVDRELLEKIADLIGKPVGAFNIRKDTGCDGRQSTENIQIAGKTDGKSGIDIRIKDGTKGEQCHIPVIITKPGIQELVYNDFYIGENCDVDIVAGCGIHNCGGEDSRHDGIHTFYVGKHSHVKYTEKHYGDGDGTGGRIMNPQTVVYLEEGATIQMETVQIRGIDSTKRETKIVCAEGQFKDFSVFPYLVPIQIDRQISKLSHVCFRFIHVGTERQCRSAYVCLYPGKQFSHTERFCHVIVSSQLETKHFVDFLIFGRKDNDRNRALFSDFFADGKSIDFGQHDVQQYEIRI